MSYLKSLEIYNFQGHRHSKLEFSPGINIITGMSNRGKTSIFRALNWQITNRPKGNEFRSNFAKDNENTKVKTIFEGNGKDKYVLIEKGKKGSAVYFIGTNGKEEDRFSGVGFDVPDRVSEFFRIDPINMQSQLEQYFLIASSPGEVAREINKTTHLEEVDQWIKKFTTKINSANKEVKIYEESIEKLSMELSEIPDIKKMEREINKLEVLFKREKEIELQGDILVDCIDNFEDVIKKLRELRIDYKIVKLIEECQEDIAYLEDIEGNIYLLNFLVESIKYEFDYSMGLGNHISEAEPIVIECQRKYSSASDMSKRITLLFDLLQDWEILSDTLKILGDEIWDDKEGLIKELRKMKKCPLCFSDIKRENIENIVSSI